MSCPQLHDNLKGLRREKGKLGRLGSDILGIIYILIRKNLLFLKEGTCLLVKVDLPEKKKKKRCVHLEIPYEQP